MTPEELAAIVARDAAVPTVDSCHDDATTFWTGLDRCAICGHGEANHDRPDHCIVVKPHKLSPHEAERRVLLALLRECRTALGSRTWGNMPPADSAASLLATLERLEP